MNRPPAVIVHSLPMAELALAPGRPLTFLSAVGAASYMGVGWWQALVRAASGEASVPHILDCGWSAGRALEALSAGQRMLVLRTDDARIWADLDGRAQDCGAILLAQPPDALDLAQRGAPPLLSAWLQAGDMDKPIG